MATLGKLRKHGWKLEYGGSQTRPPTGTSTEAHLPKVLLEQLGNVDDTGPTFPATRSPANVRGCRLPPPAGLFPAHSGLWSAGTALPAIQLTGRLASLGSLASLRPPPTRQPPDSEALECSFLFCHLQTACRTSRPAQPRGPAQNRSLSCTSVDSLGRTHGNNV